MDLVAEVGADIIPFEVKYCSRSPSAIDLKDLLEMARSKPLERAYVATKSVDDLGEIEGLDTPLRIMQIPAPLL